MTILVIQALKTIGKGNVTAKTIQTLRSRLNEKDKSAMLQEAAESTDWVYNTIRQIAKEDTTICLCPKYGSPRR